MKITSKYFGETELDTHYNALVCDAVLKIENSEIEIDLWFDEDDEITKKHIKRVDSFLDNINMHIKTAQKKVQENYNRGKGVKDYIKHHLNELNKEELMKMGVDLEFNKQEKRDVMFSKIHLVRIALYPTKSISEAFAVFEFTIGRNYTNYLIAIDMKRSGKVTEIDIQS